MSRLFKRSATVTLIKPDGLTGTTSEQIKITDLRVQFAIEKTLKKEPNQCELTITNLSETTRARIQKKPLHVEIAAGYDGNEHLVFKGDLRYGISKRDGADWNTTLELADGDRAYRYGRTNRSFRPGTKASDVIRLAAKDMGLNWIETATAFQFAGGFVARGTGAEVLTRTAKLLGLDWSIQNGQLQTLAKDAGRGEPPLLVSSDTGLIGSPEFGTPEKGNKSPNLTFEIVLTPTLYPGSIVEMDAREIKGRFKVLRVQHVGDTHGQDWKTSVECRGHKQ